MNNDCNNRGKDKFKSEARKHQEMWVRQWAKELGKDSICDERPGHEAWLQKQYASLGIVFYAPFRKDILIQSKMGKNKINMRLLSNALRSEHIPYNIFYPMMQQYNMAKTQDLFNELLHTDSIDEILDVKIEFSPQPKSKYLDDQTSFDVYVKYRHIDHRVGGIGIEVKYTEREYTIGDKEYECTHDTNGIVRLCPSYYKATWHSGYYLKDSESDLVSDCLRQVWRNHILGASMVDNGELAHFTSLTLYPSGNTHFKEVEKKYRTLLTNKGNSTFMMTTYEDFFEALAHHFSTVDDLKWISYLYDRYLFDVAKPTILNDVNYETNGDMTHVAQIGSIDGCDLCDYIVAEPKTLNRGVNRALIQAFKRSPLFNLYRQHSDELIICVRNDYLSLYYRLNCIAEVSLNSCGELVAGIHPYFLNQEGDNKKILGDQISKLIVNRYDEIKQLIKNKKTTTLEKTAQQMLVIQNNANVASKWLCVDVEWARSFSCIEEKRQADLSARMDIIAVSKEAPHRVAIIELKYGRGSLGSKAGVIKHIADFRKIQQGYDYNGKHYDYYDELKKDICNILNNYNELDIPVPASLRNVTPDDFDSAPEFFIITLDNNLKTGLATLPKQTMAAYLFSPNSPNYRKWHCTNPAKENVQDKYHIDVLDPSSPLTITFMFSKMTVSNLNINDIIEHKSYEIIRPNHRAETSNNVANIAIHGAENRSFWQRLRDRFAEIYNAVHI